MQADTQLPTTPPLSGADLVDKLNDIIQTLGTDFSGAADPASKAWPYATWADTGNMLLKRRNSANSAWVTLGPLFAGAITATVSQTLSASQAGLVLINAAGGNVTLILPLAAESLGCDFTFVRIDNSAANAVNIVRGGSDTLDGGTAAINLVGQFEKRMVVSNGASAWYTQSALLTSQATAYQTTNQGFSAATWTKVSLGAESSDVGSEFDTTNHRFIAKESGWYAIDAQVIAIGATVSVGNTLALAVYVNGSVADPGNLKYVTAAGTNAVIRTNTHIYLAKTGYAEIFARGSAGFSSEAGAQSTFAKFLRVR